MQTEVFGLVLAGGSGRRLQGITRRVTGRDTPKQYCRFGGRSLLQETLRRLASLTSGSTVVVDRAWFPTARNQVRGFADVTVVAQPGDRGTGTGLLLPLALLLGEEQRAHVVMTPADHAVADEAIFTEGVRSALRAVVRGDAGIVLCGVDASAARSDFGWIVPGAPLAPGLRRVAGFVEKPPPERARELLDRGALWNTMVLVAEGRALLDAFRALRPEMVRFFEHVAHLAPDRRREWLRRCYGLIRPCDFSRDVLEATPGLAVWAWPAELGWSDLGTPDRLIAWLGRPGARALQTSETA